MKVFIEILVEHFDMPARYVGDSRPHEVDGLISIKEGLIVIEGKRQERERIGPIKAEEVWGKGKRHNPIAYMTFGYPDFTREAITNAENTGITLLPHYILGKWIVDYHKGDLTNSEILEKLRSGKYLGYRRITKETLT